MNDELARDIDWLEKSLANAKAAGKYSIVIGTDRIKCILAALSTEPAADDVKQTGRMLMVRRQTGRMLMVRSWLNKHSDGCASLEPSESADGPPNKCNCQLPERLAVIDAAIAAIPPQPSVSESELYFLVNKLALLKAQHSDALHKEGGDIFGQMEAAADILDQIVDAIPSPLGVPAIPPQPPEGPMAEGAAENLALALANDPRTATPLEASEAFLSLTAMHSHRGDGIPTEYVHSPEVAKHARTMWKALLTAIRPQPSPAGWQPIETAPKDGTPVLLFDPEYCDVEMNPVLQGHWAERWQAAVWNNSQDYFATVDVSPTLWMPVPTTVATPVQPSPDVEEIRQAVIPVIGACLLMRSDDPKLVDPRIGVAAEVARKIATLLSTIKGDVK